MPDSAPSTLSLFDSTPFDWTIEPAKGEQSAREPSSPEFDDTAFDPPPTPTGGKNFHLDADRGLARGWSARARDNIAAIRLSKEIETTGRTPIVDEQALLLRFIGFGATELAQNCFPLPGATGFRSGWEEIGRDLAESVSPAEYAALQRTTQF